MLFRSYFQQDVGDVKQLISVPGLGGTAQVVPGSVTAAGMSPYERGRLAQGAAGLNIRAAEADPFGLMGLQQTYGVGVQPPARNALTAPAAAPAVAPTVAPAVAPAIAPAIAPAGTTSISGAPASTAVRAAIQQGLTGPEFIAALPSTVAKEVSAIIDHRMPPPSRFSKRGEQLMQLVSQADPTYDATQYGNKAAAEKQFTSGQLGSSVRSFNVAQDHLSTLAELSAALKNNDYPAINKVSQFVAQQTGSPAPTNFDAAKRIVADEIVKAVIGGRGALGDRKAADETLSKANSPEQLIGVIDTYKKLINGQLNGFEKQYEAATGKKDFRTRFLTAAAGGGPAPAPAQSSVMSQADAILSRGNK